MFDQPWSAYVPDASMPWDVRRVVHLHRRAGFAATWAEVERDLADGPQKSVDRLLAGRARLTGVPDDFARTADLLADAAAATHDPGRLQAWWVFRMLFGPDPLGERLALFWHDHFATSNQKVKDLAAMRRQNDAFRAHARAPFAALLGAAVRDPALLVFLDAPANRKGHANENLARELMELFTLGVGHYSEADVKEAARCLTGWGVEDGAFREKPAQHDGGEKTVLGRRGKWAGGDLVAMLLDHPATATRLAAKLCGLFFGDRGAGPAAVQALAARLRANGLDVGRAVETILRSRAFFAADNLGNRVVGPVEFVVGAARALEMFDPAPSTLALADWAGRLGQVLFEPPNVGGWPGGRAWLSSRAVIGRANFVAALLEGPHVGRPAPFDAAALAKKHGAGDPPAFYSRLLLGTDPLPAWRSAAEPRKVVALILAAPEAQLC